MTRMEDLKPDALINGLLKGLDGKAVRLIRAVWASVRRSCPAPAVVI
jgi:hypothetical protein